jgi:nicotinamide mononucleotide transporter
MLDAATATAFTAWGGPVTVLELAAFVAALMMVVANLRVHPVGWPLAMFSSAAYGLLFWQNKLYGEAGLQLLFIALSVWGWWQWLRNSTGNSPGKALRVRHLTPRQRGWAAAATLAAWPLLGLLLARTTDSDVPYLDALATAGSVTGQILLGRKFVDNWPTWAAVNAFSVLLFASKGLTLTSILYALFAALSLWGWLGWRRLAAENSAAPSP